MLFGRVTERGKFGVLLGVSFALWSGPVRAAPPERPLYTIAIGENEVPAGLSGQDDGLSQLRYADDDAAQLFLLLRNSSRKAFLLAVPDTETQARFPDAAAVAVPPTQSALDHTVDEVRQAMERDRAAGLEPVLFFFFSGHGVRDKNGRAALALFDGALTQSWLYERLLPTLPARFVHLVIDACHAGAVVRSRDVDATLEPLGELETQRYLADSTLARFPHVGAILASTASTRSFEWEAYRGGVFAHELLSGLRGAADVNGDGRIEYSELSAFFSAANLRIDDPRARLEIVAEPPRADARAPVFEHPQSSGEFTLVGRGDAPWSSPFYVETADGLRLLDAFPERGMALRLWLPSGEDLYVVSENREALVSGVPGRQVSLGSLKTRPVRNRSRGALDSSLRRGLFGTRFGPAFYLGFTSQRAGLVPVPLLAEGPEEERAPAPAKRAPDVAVRTGREPWGIALLAAGGAAAVSAGVFTGLALAARADYGEAEYERTAKEASDRFDRYQTAAWVSGGAAAALAATGAVLLLWPAPKARTASTVSFDSVSVTARGIGLGGSF